MANLLPHLLYFYIQLFKISEKFKCDFVQILLGSTGLDNYTAVSFLCWSLAGLSEVTNTLASAYVIPIIEMATTCLTLAFGRSQENT